MNWNTIPKTLQDKQKQVYKHTAETPLLPIGNLTTTMRLTTIWSYSQGVCKWLLQYNSEQATSKGFIYPKSDDVMIIHAVDWLNYEYSFLKVKAFTTHQELNYQIWTRAIADVVDGQLITDDEKNSLITNPQKRRKYDQ